VERGEEEWRGGRKRGKKTLVPPLHPMERGGGGEVLLG